MSGYISVFSRSDYCDHLYDKTDILPLSLDLDHKKAARHDAPVASVPHPERGLKTLVIAFCSV
jgi:hypothetical protein